MTDPVGPDDNAATPSRENRAWRAPNGADTELDRAPLV